jgi:MFS family permease
VALPWFVLVTTGSPVRTGITAFAATAPLAAGAILGGAIVERVGLRRASVLSDLAAALAIAGIPLLHELGVLRFWEILALAFVAAACEAPGRAARRAMTPELARRAGMPLERANSIATTSEHTGYVLGAPVAGVLIAAAGPPNAIWVDAASFALSGLIVILAVPSLASAGQPARLADALRLVARTPLLRTFFVIWTVGAVLIGPLSAVVLPVYAREEFGGAGSLAACVTAYGLGGLAGTLAYAVGGVRLSRRTFYVATWTVYPALTVVLVGTPGLAGVLALLFGIGLIAGAYDPFEITVHQELVPPDLRARAFGLLIAADATAIPLSMLLYGGIIGTLGLRAALVFYAAGNLVLGTYAIVNRSARAL